MPEEDREAHVSKDGRTRRSWIARDALRSEPALKKRLLTMRIGTHAPGGGGRKWMLCSAASATTASGVCSFMLWIAQNRS